jgi:archaellum biogenesis protein FlaJ (TadC family)
MVFVKACKCYSDRKVISKIKAKLKLNPEGRQTVFVFEHVGSLHTIWIFYHWSILIGSFINGITGNRRDPKKVIYSLFFYR